MTLNGKWLKRFAVLFVCFALPVGGYTGYELLTGNVHRLPDGQVYRSAELDQSCLAHLIRAHGIRSVLNLQGPSRGQWYFAETNLCSELGVQHVDLKLSAHRQLTELDLDRLVERMRDLPKPMLIHCKGGADRTGLACALYRYDVLGEPASLADDELSFRYGHIPYFRWRYSIAMDRSFWAHVESHPAGQHL